MKEYTLRELCEKCGVTRRALQWYEKFGIVKAIGKNKMSHLLYDEETVKKVKEIKALQNYGLSVSEIKEYLESGSEKQKTFLIQKHEKLKEKCSRMISYLKEIENLIEKK